MIKVNIQNKNIFFTFAWMKQKYVSNRIFKFLIFYAFDIQNSNLP